MAGFATSCRGIKSGSHGVGAGGDSSRNGSRCFLGQDADINIETEHPEFSAWRWAAADDLAAMTVPFKRTMYLDLVEQFHTIHATDVN